MTGRAFAEGGSGQALVLVTIVLRRFGSGRLVGRWRRLLVGEQFSASGELLLPAGIGEEAVITDPLKAPGNDMQQKAADEFLTCQRHGFLLVVVAIILPAEADVGVVHAFQSIVGDGHAVRVTSDIVQNLFRPSEGPLGMDDPFRVPERSQGAQECTPLPKRLESMEELQFACIKGRGEIFQEQPAEQTRQDRYGQEEALAAADPSCAIRGEPAAGDYAMQVGMMKKILAPGVEHGEEADLRAEVLRIGGDDAQGMRASP